MKYALSLVIVMLINAVGLPAFAQPVNDEVAGAITLTVVSSDAYGNNCTPSTNIVGQEQPKVPIVSGVVVM